MTEQIDEWLIGIRLRDTVPADDFKLVEDLAVTVGDIVLVETGSSTALGEIRRPRRAVPEFKRDRLFRRVVRIATDAEAREYRDRRQREERAIATAQRVVHSREMPMKVVDVEMYGPERRVTVYFNAEDRLDFRDLVRDLAREFRARDRDAAGRRPRHDAGDGRHRPVRPPALLLVASAEVRPDLGEDGQGRRTCR